MEKEYIEFEKSDGHPVILFDMPGKWGLPKWLQDQLGLNNDIKNGITHMNVHDIYWFSDEDLRNFCIREEDIHPFFEFNNSQIAFRLLFDREVKGFGHGYYVEIIGFVRNGEKYGKI